MGSVIKKTKKTLLERLVTKVKSVSQHEPVDTINPVYFDDTSADSDEAAMIASRRNEMKSENQYRPDATVSFKKGKGG